MYAEVDVLLTLEQYQQMVPSTSACYVSYGTLIRYETISVPISHLHELRQAPHLLLNWDAASQTLLQVSQPVSAFCVVATAQFCDCYF